MLLAVLHSLELLLSELNFHFIARHFRIRNGGEKKKRKRKMKRRLVYSTREIYYRPFRGGTSRCREKFVLQKEEKKTRRLFLLFWFMLFWPAAGKTWIVAAAKQRQERQAWLGRKLNYPCHRLWQGPRYPLLDDRVLLVWQSVADGAKKKKNCDGGVDRGDRGTDRASRLW